MGIFDRFTEGAKKRLHLHRKAQNSLDTIMWEVSTC